MIERELVFPEGRRAKLVEIPSSAQLEDAIEALGLEQPEAVVMIASGAARLDGFLAKHEDRRAALLSLLDHGFAPAVGAARALVIDGATQAGAMALVGRALARAGAGAGASLVGVAPAALVSFPDGPDRGEAAVPLDPNHPRLLTVAGEDWGDEREAMYDLAELAVAGRIGDSEGSGARRPALCLLINGGENAKREVLACVRRGWPVIVVEGSGGLADELLASEPGGAATDPLRAEIRAEGELHRVPIDGDPEKLRRLIAELLDPETHEALLTHAWASFARYDRAANEHQRKFGRAQVLISALGLLAIAAALLQTQLEAMALDVAEPALEGLRWLIIALPISLSIVMAVTGRFKRGSKWILTRAAAESVKREIFLFRGRAGPYADEAPRPRDQAFADRLTAIGEQAMATQASESALPEVATPLATSGGDDGLSDLDANAYIRHRLADQLDYYAAKTRALDAQLSRLSWLIYIVGGLGTLLAALGAELWVALTTATAGAFTTYLEYQQTEFNLVKYNQTRAKLEGIHTWWQGLSPAEHSPENFRLLVTRTEQALDSEFSGWLKNMQDNLELLRGSQPKRESDAD